MSFQNIFPNYNPYNILKNQTSRILIENYGNYYIYLCFFINLSFSNSGGAIYLLLPSTTGSIINILCTKSIFISVTITNGTGGAIYINSNSIGGLVFTYNCGYNCYCFDDSNSQFSYLSGNSNNFIDFKYNTIHYCSPEPLSRDFSNEILYSNITFDHINSSKNFLDNFGSVRFSNSFQLILSFCNIINNIVSNSRILVFLRGSNEIIGQYSNFINNSQNTDSIGLIRNNQPNTILKYFICLLNNKNNKGKLFYCDINFLNLYYCYIDNLLTYGTINNNNQLDITNSINIQHLNTIYCEYDYTKKRNHYNQRIFQPFNFLNRE